VDPWMNLDAPTRFFSMQLAPDGKIYITTPNYPTHYYHVIDRPDLAGAACQFRQHAVYLPFLNSFSIPNNPWYDLKDWEGSPCDTLITPVATYSLGRQALDFKAYPNPTDNILHIETGLPGTCTVEVLDLLGQRLSQADFVGRTELSMGAYPPGLYVLRYWQDGKALGVEKVALE
jgi:hypothetical protein